MPEENPPKRTFSDLVNHLSAHIAPDGVEHDNLETAVENYRSFEKEDLPVFHEHNVEQQRGIYDTLKQHVSGTLGTEGSEHVNQKVADHRDTLEDALFSALKNYHASHGIDVDHALGIFGDKQDEKLEWLATVYDQRTGADPREGEGMSAILRAIRNFGPDRTISDLYQQLREETDKKGPERAFKTMLQKARSKAFGDFEDFTLATYLHKKIGDRYDVHDPTQFFQAAPRQFYTLLERHDKMEHEQLAAAGLSRKEESYDKAA